MARPIKNNADYFPHDADMRNDDRMKALRRKFGFEGYAVYNMMLEYLTNSDYFQFQESELKVELIAGDFDIAPDRLLEILTYCVAINLFQRTDTGLWGCVTLNNRLVQLLSKRKRDRDGVIDGENPQSKVKESKEEKTRAEEIPTMFRIYGIISERSPVITCKWKYTTDPTPCRVYGVDGMKDFLQEYAGTIVAPDYLEKFMRQKNGNLYDDGASFVINSLKSFVKEQFA